MTNLLVILTPTWDGEKIPTLKVCLQGDIMADENNVLFSINKRTIFKPFTTLKNPIVVHDQQGEVEYETKNTENGHVTLTNYTIDRQVVGKAEISYTLLLEEAGRNPVFDLGYEKGGMTGSGMTFMPNLPKGDYNFTLVWNMSDLPSRAIGTWSYGQGTVEIQGDENTLTNTFYSAGLLDCVRMGRFSYYWFSCEKLLETALYAAKLFAFEAEFFKDNNEPYTIFSRRSRHCEGRVGGTALQRSYMFIYGEENQIEENWCKFLFAHEMIHNWVNMANEPFGTGTWYIEGMAEYYSALIPWKMGIVSKETLCVELNKRSAKYFENPKINCTNKQAGEQLMADPEITRVPYGRGFFYLTHADSQIRKATNGQKCLDDIMHILLDQSKTKIEPTNETWIKEYAKYVGENVAQTEYEQMAQGGTIVPCVECFEGAISLSQKQGEQRETKQPCVLWSFE